MARPTKSVALTVGKIGNEERAKRRAQEQKLKGAADKLRPPKYLSKEQKAIFKFIVKELEASQILGNIDIFLLEKASISIDRLRTLEEGFNNDPTYLLNPDIIRLQGVYSKDFYRCCNELSLSPQSRAKIANNTTMSKKQKANPILKLVEGGNGG